MGDIRELTGADYNYPADNPTSIGLWLLEPGIYYAKSGVYVRPILSGQYDGGALAIVGKYDSNRKNIFYVNQPWNGRAEVTQEAVDATSGNLVSSNMSTTLASLSDLYADPSSKTRVKITSSGSASGEHATGVGYDTYATADKATALGSHTAVRQSFSTAVGAGATTNVAGEMNIGTGPTYPTRGYNGTAYRILTGVHDGIDAHSAATVGQITPLSDTTAPTTATVGTLGKIYIDTTNGDAYMCVAVDDATPSYTWRKITS